MHYAFDAWMKREFPGIGFERYCDDVVVHCKSERQAKYILSAITERLARCKLAVSPDKTRLVYCKGDHRLGSHEHERFDFLGCHFHGRVSGKMLERGIRRYYLHRWPSARSMKRVRQRVKELTGRNRNGVKDVRVLILDLNPILRGWGNYFRTGNAAQKFRQIDAYVEKRLRNFLVKRHGRNLRAGRIDVWTEDWFNAHGLYRLRGTIRYPGTA